MSRPSSRGRLEDADWPGLFAHLRVPEPRLEYEHTGLGLYVHRDPRYRYCPAYFNYGRDRGTRPRSPRSAAVGSHHLTRPLANVGRATIDAQLALATSIARLELPVRRLPLRYNMANNPLLEATASQGDRARHDPPPACRAAFSPRRDLRVARQPGGLPGTHRPAGRQPHGPGGHPGHLPGPGG